MSAARNRLAATVGVVKVLEPNAQGYYRLKWTEPDGTPGDTSAGKILELAPEEATEVNNQVTSAAGPLAVTALDVVVAAYLAAGHSPYKDKKPWKPANKTQIEDNLTRCVRSFGHLRAMDVTRELCDRMRAPRPAPRPWCASTPTSCGPSCTGVSRTATSPAAGRASAPRLQHAGAGHPPVPRPGRQEQPGGPGAHERAGGDLRPRRGRPVP